MVKADDWIVQVHDLVPGSSPDQVYLAEIVLTLGPRSQVHCYPLVKADILNAKPNSSFNLS